MSFEITSPSITHCGAGAFAKIADESARLGKRAAIVTGAHMHASDRVDKLIEDLRGRGVAAVLSDPITSEPTVEMVDDLAAFLRQNKADFVISIGGGSVIEAPHTGDVVRYGSLGGRDAWIGGRF